MMKGWTASPFHFPVSAKYAFTFATIGPAAPTAAAACWPLSGRIKDFNALSVSWRTVIGRHAPRGFIAPAGQRLRQSGSRQGQGEAWASHRLGQTETQGNLVS